MFYYFKTTKRKLHIVYFIALFLLYVCDCNCLVTQKLIFFNEQMKRTKCFSFKTEQIPLGIFMYVNVFREIYNI